MASGRKRSVDAISVAYGLAVSFLQIGRNGGGKEREKGVIYTKYRKCIPWVLFESI